MKHSNKSQKYEEEQHIAKKGQWIFSGDSDDYDDYCINCSVCGMQRWAYDRENRLDCPNYCPYCGSKNS